MGDPDDIAAVRRQFLDEGRASSRRGALAFCGLAMAMTLGSIAGTWYDAGPQFTELLQIRLATLAALGGLAALLVHPLGAQRPRELAVACFVVMSIGMHALAELTGGQASAQYDRLTWVLLSPAILMTWSGWWAAVSSAAVLAVFVGGSAAEGTLAGSGFIGNLGRLGLSSLVAVAAAILRERTRWRSLWALHELASARDRVAGELRRLREGFEHQLGERTAVLRASEARFRAMFEAAPLGVATLDLDGRITQANDAFAALAGGTADEAVGRSLLALCAPAERDTLRDGLAALADGASAPHSFDAQLGGAHGLRRPVHGALTPIRDAGQRVVGALVMLEDVSAQVRAESDAGERQEHLAHVLRMTAMGGMLAELAHELNQPLGAIVNFAQGASARLRRAGADPALGAAMDEISAEARRAGEILRRVRDVVRRGEAPSEPIDLNALVREAAHAIEPVARRHTIPLRLELDPAVPRLLLDRVHVEQVLLNLLRNAVDAIAAAPPAEHEIVVRTTPGNGSGVEVQVRDTGVGLPGDAGERIFEAFYTTKPRGLGIGLSISRSIVEAYGGRLRANGNADRGATFTLTLPR